MLFGNDLMSKVLVEFLDHSLREVPLPSDFDDVLHRPHLLMLKEEADAKNDCNLAHRVRDRFDDVPSCKHNQ